MSKDHLTEIDPAAPVTEQACHWWVLLNSGEATPADHRTFGEWVARSPERIEAYLQVARLTRALSSGRLRWPGTPVADLIREARAVSGEPIRLPTPRVPGAREDLRDRMSETAEGSRWRFRRWLHLAAAAIALAVVTGGFLLLTSPRYYRTGLGEQRSIVLGDGSVVTLNTSSSIEVCLRKHRRMVRLLTGEALFQVAHDASRPFDVSVGETTVRAVGTQFDVRRRGSGTTVAVVEGKVAVLVPSELSTTSGREPELGGSADTALANLTFPVVAGEQLTVGRRGAPTRSKADAAVITAWTQRKLIFEQRPLGEIAEEFNRYNRQTIEIRSEALRDQRVTGVFQANDPESFIAFLSRVPDVTVERSDDGMRYVVTSTNPIHR